MKNKILALLFCAIMCITSFTLSGCFENTDTDNITNDSSAHIEEDKVEKKEDNSNNTDNDNGNGGDGTDSHVHHAHHYPAVQPTCKTVGNTEYWHCEGCNKRFSDEALTNEVSVADSTLTIVATAHESDDFIYSANIADSTKHDKRHTCCGVTVETVAHEWDSGVADTVNPQEMIFNCLKCSASKRVPIQSQPVEGHIHTSIAVNAIPPTCTVDGNFKYWYCEGCNTKFSDEELTTPTNNASVVWEKTGHSVNTWIFVNESPIVGSTCEFAQTFGGTCSVCSASDTKTVNTTRHTKIASVTTAAKCNENGTKSYTCVHGCAGVSEQRNYTDINAHAWISGETVSGVTTYTCSHCSATKTVVEHTDDEATLDKSVLAVNEVSLNGISMKLDSTTLGLLDEGDVSLEAKTMGDGDKQTLASNLTGALRDLVLNSTVYDFGIKQDNTYVSDFEGGTVTVSVPYTLSSTDDIDCLAVCYVASDGTLEVIPATYSNGYLTFEAEHFSAYIPTYVDKDAACELYGHNFNSEKIDATCTERGYTVNCCERCMGNFITDIIYAQGHLWDAGVGTAATCTSEGNITYTCTREGCNETLAVATAKLPHSYEYDEENSINTTCTEDGYHVEVCSECGDKRVTVYEASGHMTTFGRCEYSLVAGASNCIGGVEEKRYCEYPDCTYSEIVGTYNQHVYIVDKFTNPEDYPVIAEQTVTVNVLDYTDYDFMQWVNGDIPPTITITPGCLCGELISSIEFNGGDLLSDFANYGTNFTSSTEPERVFRIGGYGDPVNGFSPDLYIRFEVSSETVDCKVKVYVDAYIAPNEDGSEAYYHERFWISEQEAHTRSTSAVLVTEGLTCYESSRQNDFEGIIETTICTTCNEVLEERFVSVGSSSSHYYLTHKNELTQKNEYYTYTVPLINSSYTSHSISFTRQYCPCGTFYVKRTGYCSFSKISSATVDGNDIDIYSCYSCGFKYGYLEESDNSTCYKNTEYTYYVNFDTENNTYDAKLSYDIGYISHNRKIDEQKLPSDDPCIYKYNQHTYCLDCNEVLSDYVYTRWTHDEHTVTTEDSLGNVTTNISCKREGCIYQSNVIRDKNGNVLRDYSVSKDITSGNTVKYLSIKTEMGGMFYDTFNRSETYNSDGELISWTQSTLEFGYDEKYGRCIRIERYSTSDGSYYEYTYSNCSYDYDKTVSQQATCTQEGYEYYVCNVCGGKNYMYQEPPRGHYYTPIYAEDGYTVIGYCCMTCGLEASNSYNCSVEVEYLTAISTEDTFFVGYYNRYAGEDYDGIAAEVTLVLATLANDGTITDESEITTVEIVDDGVSKLSVDAHALEAILDEFDGNCFIMLKVELNDGTDAIFKIKLV